MTDGVTDEELIEIFDSIFCTYYHITAYYTAAGSAGGCGDYTEYVFIHDDPGYHHDHPGAFGIFYFPIPFAYSIPHSSFHIF